MPQKEVLSLGAVVKLRVTRFEQICRTAGHKTNEAQAAHVRLTPGGLSKIKRGTSGPNADSIGAILAAFPDWTFEDLFEVKADAAERELTP